MVTRQYHSKARVRISLAQILVYAILAALLASCATGEDDSNGSNGQGLISRFVEVDPPEAPVRSQPTPPGGLSPGIGPHNRAPTPDEWSDYLVAGDLDSLVAETSAVIQEGPANQLFVIATVYGAVARLEQGATDPGVIVADLGSVEAFVRTDLWQEAPDVLGLLLAGNIVALGQEGEIDLAERYRDEALQLFPSVDDTIRALFDEARALEK